MHITNLISQKFGKFAKREFSPSFQSFINNTYVKTLGLNMDEFKDPSEYKTLNQLFTRALEKPRKIDMQDSNFISPADSLISECGSLKDFELMQIKGMSYSVDELLTEFVGKNVERVRDGEYMNYYLSPKDYHRYHASNSCRITKLIHVPGKLYPVNFKYLNKELNLFVKNERVILECFDSSDRLFYMVFVGALNVGEMVFEFEPEVETNKDCYKTRVIEYDNLHVNKGDMLGYFKMGSTVVMIWEKDFINLNNLTNQKVSFGTIVATKK